MKKEIISTTRAPAAVGPYSQGVAVGGLIFFSGQIPLNPSTGALVAGDIAAQARQACENVGALLAARGLDFSHVVKSTVFITDMAQFPEVNAVYAEYFKEPCPARSCVAVAALPLGALVEIETIAAL